MTNQPSTRRWLRIGVVVALVAALAGGIYMMWPGRAGHKVVAYFESAVGLYPGDDVRIVGVTVGTIKTIEPQPESVKITMSVHDDVKLPANVQAVIMAPNIVAARFVQLAPAYTTGAVLADGTPIDLKRTASPVEWDEVKTELTKLSTTLGPQAGSVQGPLGKFVDQAAATFDGNGDSFRQALRELSQTAGRLGDSRTDLFGTVKNLQILINALSKSNEQIVQFSGHLASVSQVLADSSSNLDGTLGTLNEALSDVRGFLSDNNNVLIGQVDKLSQLTKLFADQHDDLEQILHVTPNGLANFYNIYNPAQGTANGLLSLPNFANPVQFICGGVFEGSMYVDNIKRAEICRERMAPVLQRIAMNYPPVLLHPINTMTAYKGQVQYDTPATEAKAKTYLPYLQWIPADGRTPPRMGDAGIDQLMLPPNPMQGPPPPAQPQFLQPAGPPPGPDAPGAPPDPAPGSFPAEGVAPMQPGVGG
ncbi:MAG: phospholipid/cholesterol/gamma-HCH transport system substrate-binding protein [Mycobacterium sp.]|jgi:phospholipid/cholesterol/gamma-HCH transport system substrate-binding protein|nr:phospholipid/cholesterol/gamma-HCH transport system substrate-binding protein [Mycobacterium sp.]